MFANTALIHDKAPEIDISSLNLVTCKFEAKRKALLLRVLARLAQENLADAFDSWSMATEGYKKHLATEQDILESNGSGKNSVCSLCIVMI